MGNNKESDTILEMDIQVTKVMKDLRSRVDKVYNRYMNESKKIPELPDFDSLLKSNRLRFNTSKKLTEMLDELIELKLRVSIVYRNLSSMEKVQITSKSEYTLIRNFQSNIKKYLEELNEYKFEISDLMKNANNKIRILDSFSFYEG